MTLNGGFLIRARRAEGRNEVMHYNLVRYKGISIKT